MGRSDSMPRAVGDGVVPTADMPLRWPSVPRPQLPVGSRILPPWQRRRLDRVHRFAALANLVAGQSGAVLDRLEADLNDVLAGDRVGQSIVNDLRHNRRRYPEWALRHIIAATRQDHLGTTYRDHDQLAAYCRLSGGSLGALTVHALAASPDDAAVATGMAICSAARLIVICASVQADAKHGRCYVPTAELEFHGVTPERVVTDLPEVAGSVSQIVTGIGARAIYELQHGVRELPKLPPFARVGIAGIAAEADFLHRQLQRTHFDVLRPPPPIRPRQAVRPLSQAVRGHF